MLADSADNIAGLELLKPVITPDALLLSRAFFEFLLGLLERLQILGRHVDNFARLGQQGRILTLLVELVAPSSEVGSFYAR